MTKNFPALDNMASREIRYILGRILYWQSEIDRMLRHHSYAADLDPAENPVAKYLKHCKRMLANERQHEDEHWTKEMEKLDESI